MKLKILNLLLIVSSLFGYLEWGSSNSSFLFQGEYEVLSKIFTDPNAVVHPFTIIPLLGQLLLFITLFQQKPSAFLTYLGMGCLGLLFAFMLFIGIYSMHASIFISTLPFFILSTITVIHLKKLKRDENIMKKKMTFKTG